jgi:hypothetical protein
MKRIVVAAVAAASLVGAGDAMAGCFATVGLSSTPEGVTAGQAWNVDVTVLQHGRTPMPDAKPAVIVRNAATGQTQRFPATRTGKVGTYRASVTFPKSGTWSYAVYDGFPVAECAQTKTFAAVSIASGGGGGLGGAMSSPWWLGGAALALAAVGGAVVLMRRQRLQPVALPPGHVKGA